MFRNDGSIHQQRLLDFLVQSTLISRHQSIWMVDGFHDNWNMFTSKKNTYSCRWITVTPSRQFELFDQFSPWGWNLHLGSRLNWFITKVNRLPFIRMNEILTHCYHVLATPVPPKENHGIIRLDSYIPMSTNKLLGPVSVLPCQDSQWKWWPSLAYSHRSHHPGSRTYFDYSSLL